MLRKLEAQNAALREADRRKDAFFAELGHELRNPLGSIMNAVEILRTDDASERALAIEVIARQIPTIDAPDRRPARCHAYQTR